MRQHDSATQDDATAADTARVLLGLRLRAIRSQQGLTLQDVEERSDGRWKAVVIGSYERGDRAISLVKLIELAAFYGVPTWDLLPSPSQPLEQHTDEAGDPRVVIDLARLEHNDDVRLTTLGRYAERIRSRRGDYNGRVLTMRSADLQAIAAASGVPEQELLDAMQCSEILQAPAH